MGHGKKEGRKNLKAWKILKGTYKQKEKILKERVERLIAAVQQEIEWDQTDIDTGELIQQGKLDWSGDVRSKRRTRKNIRRRS
jgi:hypothetical protein